MAEDNKRPIIIRRIKKSGDGHHGGAWKVAYADFVTAMMAFFLLLWLLNAVTEEQLNGVAGYFTPEALSTSSSGAGGALGGKVIGEGASESNSGAPMPVPLPPSTIGQGGEPVDPSRLDEKALAEIAARFEQQQMAELKAELKAQMAGVPSLQDLQSNVLIDKTPEGVRIQIIDREGLDMFPSGSAAMFRHTREILGMVARLIRDLPNDVSISGHTDSVPFNSAGYTNWELSADRALASRKVLVDSGLREARVAKVTGQADKDPLLPDQPDAARNRRISIVLLRDDALAQEELGPIPSILRRNIQR